VRITDLYADGFQPALSCQERRTHKEPGVLSELQPYADDLGWAEALVLVYPTWWSGQPAMLKGWIDRVWVAGVAWELPDGANVLRPLLTKVRRIVVVTTHGSAKYVNALEGESGKRTVTRSMRAMCNKRVRTTWCAIYGLDRATEDKRIAFLDRVERTMTRL
jgi:putative NADPH-quinone reductase